MNRIFDLSQPVVFAHRGASRFAPENTLAAFQKAVNCGAPAIELDAKLTGDGQIVVIHDMTVNRTTNGKGAVRAMSLAALQELDAGGWFSPLYQKERIPTLKEVLETFGKKLYVNIELTNYASTDDALPEMAVELVQRMGLMDEVIFSSFVAKNLMRVRAAAPEAMLGYLYPSGLMGWLATNLGSRRLLLQAAHPNADMVNQKFIERQHALNRRVHVWTVNDREQMENLFKQGVDGIFTDDPALALQARSESLNL